MYLKEDEDMMKNNFPTTVPDIIANDEAFAFCLDIATSPEIDGYPRLMPGGGYQYAALPANQVPRSWLKYAATEEAREVPRAIGLYGGLATVIAGGLTTVVSTVGFTSLVLIGGAIAGLGATGLLTGGLPLLKGKRMIQADENYRSVIRDIREILYFEYANRNFKKYEEGKEWVGGKEWIATLEPIARAAVFQGIRDILAEHVTYEKYKEAKIRQQAEKVLINEPRSGALELMRSSRHQLVEAAYLRSSAILTGQSGTDEQKKIAAELEAIPFESMSEQVDNFKKVKALLNQVSRGELSR